MPLCNTEPSIISSKFGISHKTLITWSHEYLNAILPSVYRNYKTVVSQVAQQGHPRLHLLFQKNYQYISTTLFHAPKHLCLDHQLQGQPINKECQAKEAPTIDSRTCQLFSTWQGWALQPHHRAPSPVALTVHLGNDCTVDLNIIHFSTPVSGSIPVSTTLHNDLPPCWSLVLREAYALWS